MESLDFTYNLVDLKISKVKYLSNYTLCLECFRNMVIVMTKGKK